MSRKDNDKEPHRKTKQTTHITFCRICESLCGLEVQVADGRVTAIKPDARHLTTHGFACPKGLKQHRLYSSADRLQQPQKNTPDGWAVISWDKALQEIGDKLAQIKSAHGGDSIAMYVGTAAGFGVLHPVFAQGFMDAMGSRNMFSSATQDCSNKFAVSHRMYGFPFTLPFPDLLNTNCLIIVGANPMVSKWSFLQVPNPRKHINEIKSRGGRVIVVDPRNTETAKAAGEHLFIRPNSDVYFYLAFLHCLIEAGQISRQLVDRHTTGFKQIKDLVADWSPERSAQYTGIEAQAMRDLVTAYSEADGAALYCSTGVNMGAHGTLAFYLQEVINAVSGNLDRRGGTLVGKGIFDFARFGKKYGLLVKDDRSRVGGYGKTNDAFPGGILADEILTPGKGQIRALIVTGGNPLLTMADSSKLAKAFQKLELLVTLDIQPSETAMAGHYILPCTSPLERPDLPFVFPLTLGLQVRPYLQATRAIVPPTGESRDEATIYTDLAAAAGENLFGSALFQRLMQWSKRKRGRDNYRSVAQQGLLNLILKLSGQPGFNKLLGHGWLRPANEPGSFLGKRVYTSKQGDGLIDLAPADLIRALQTLIDSSDPSEARLQARTDGAERSYQLITKRQVETHNSWTHNLPDFLQRLEDQNFVYMHPEDAALERFAETDLIDIKSTAGAVRLPLRLTQDLTRGVVAVPHGWGHQSSGLKHARESGGVNVNLLASSGPGHIDPISGMSQLTGLRVQLSASGNHSGSTARTDWSGYPASTP